MNIQESFPNSPAFKAFRERVGPLAMEYIVRLGIHCVHSRITFLPGEAVDLHYLSGAREEITKEGLEAALAETGMIQPDDGGYQMTFFREMNGKLVKNWENGQKFGFGSQHRKKKAKDVPENTKKPEETEGCPF